MRILLIIPAYNEEKNIDDVVFKIEKYKGEMSQEFDLDYVIINDGSIDNTGTICKAKGYNCINLIQNLGIGGAVQTGYKYAVKNDYDIAIQFDGDGQHDVEYVKELIAPLVKGECDFSIGSRFIKGSLSSFQSTLMRRIGIRWLSFLIKLFTGKSVTDSTSGFRAANREVCRFFSKSYPVDYPEPESTVELLKNSYRIAEVAVNMNERTGGSSSIGSWKSVYYMIKVSLAIVITSLQGRV